MSKATDGEIIEFVKNTYKGLFKTMTVSSIETGTPDKYGSVVHNVFARTRWNDCTVTDNRFSCNEQDGELY
ncbi:hypothetical protein SEA_BOSSLADY_79 [Arthrobacter phage BossLady]|uniref:Uncharacterized protein n=1 Tax=Arthrobacter phage BossLady TaxID=2603258 RepID=A0A5B8WJ62_9CAUD|nr:hypothetical protein SEA_BOSSLADY_79 [Arthrobacter phage BossLady]